MRDFGEVRGLGGRELRSLLVEGEPLERVWAAWALGMALGADAVPVTRERADREPDPGVRRHLVVVLAGLGAWDLVAALAASDPDPYVRAAAVTCLARGGRSDAAWAALADASAVVKEALIVALAWPDERLDDLVALARAPELRLAALEALAGRHLSDALLAELAALLPVEPSSMLRRLVWDLLLAHGRFVALRHARVLPNALVVELCALLEGPLDWEEARHFGWQGREWLGPQHVVLETVPPEVAMNLWRNREVYRCDRRDGH